MEMIDTCNCIDVQMAFSMFLHAPGNMIIGKVVATWGYLMVGDPDGYVPVWIFRLIVRAILDLRQQQLIEAV